MLTPQIKQRILAAMKAQQTLERDILKVVLGDLQMGATRKGADLTEEEEQKIIKAMVKSMHETLAAAPDAPEVPKFKQELVILESLLPQSLSAEQVLAALTPAADAIRAAPSDGAATGVAMKQLKSAGLPGAVDGKVVAQVVREIRA